MLQCTDEEVAAWFSVSTRTIERRRKTGKFAEIMERGRAKGRISLRRTQMRLAEQGSGSVAIWLGKQLLDQVDHIDHRVEQSNILRVICMPKIWDVPTVQGGPSSAAAWNAGFADYAAWFAREANRCGRSS